MGRWRLTPPGYWGDPAYGREIIPVGDKYYACAAAAASWLSPGGEAASGGHISFCEERNVGKKVA